MRIVKVCADVRYKQDAHIKTPEMTDFFEDSDGEIPCMEGSCWCPEIDVDRGVILNWTQGTEARVNYKVCDCFSAKAFVEDNAFSVPIAKVEDEYVPKFMCPREEGYGDYICMDIKADGTIEGWNTSLYNKWLEQVKEK